MEVGLDLYQPLNCHEFVASFLGIDVLTMPNDERISKIFDVVTDPKDADVVGVRTSYADGESAYTHMGLVINDDGKIFIDHVPNVYVRRELHVDIEEFEARYRKEDTKIVFLKLKPNSANEV